MNYYTAIRLSAMRSVIEPDGDAHLRHIFRWYSKKFSTPLHVVEELPTEEVLIAFYEETYENMSEEERETELRELLESPEEKERRLREFEEEEMEIAAFAKMTQEQEAAKEKAYAEGSKDSEGFPVSKMVEQRTFVKGKDEIEEGMEIVFMNEEDFEAALEGESIPMKQSSD